MQIIPLLCANVKQLANALISWQRYGVDVAHGLVLQSPVPPSGSLPDIFPLFLELLKH